jgi:aromatic ring-opening dioxygenase LigB subunit
VDEVLENVEPCGSGELVMFKQLLECIQGKYEMGMGYSRVWGMLRCEKCGIVSL